MLHLDPKCPVCGKTLTIFIADNRCSISCNNCYIYAQATTPILCSKIFNRIARRRRVQNILKGLGYKNVSADGKWQ